MRGYVIYFGVNASIILDMKRFPFVDFGLICGFKIVAYYAKILKCSSYLVNNSIIIIKLWKVFFNINCYKLSYLQH